MGLTRRDILTLGLGAAAAIPWTPVPWKLLDDSAKWSQNWSWIPRPPRGQRSVRYGSCTLCPAGCGIQARCVGRNVIGIAPAKSHPVSQGVLCSYAFGAHQLPFHPSRIARPLRHGNSISMDRAAAEISSRVSAGRIGILDERPGRAVSAAYRRIADTRGGVYIVADRSETTTLECFAHGSGRNLADLGLDLENTRTLVSFGAPVLEGWATPGRVLKLWKENQLAVVQVEAGLSKTAALATRWLPARAGSEGMIVSLLTGNASIEATAAATGVPSETLAGVLLLIRERGSMLALSGGGHPAGVEQGIAALNAGSKTVVARGTSPGAEPLSQVPRGSLDVLFVDHGYLGGSAPYELLRQTLRSDGVVVSLSPYRAGVSALADFVIPTPAFGESLDEAPTPWDAIAPSYSLAPAFIDSPPGVAPPLDFVNVVTGGKVGPEAAIRAGVERLFTARRGEIVTVADGLTRPMTDFKTSSEVFKTLVGGACWIDRDAKTVAVNCCLVANRSESRNATAMRGTAVTPSLWRA